MPQLLDRANVDDDVKVLVVRGAGDDFGSGADLPELAALMAESPEAAISEELGLDRGRRDLSRRPSRTGPERPSDSGTPTRGPGAGRFRTSRRSASSRRRATATDGTSTRRPTPIW